MQSNEHTEREEGRHASPPTRWVKFHPNNPRQKKQFSPLFVFGSTLNNSINEGRRVVQSLEDISLEVQWMWPSVLAGLITEIWSRMDTDPVHYGNTCLLDKGDTLNQRECECPWVRDRRDTSNVEQEKKINHKQGQRQSQSNGTFFNCFILCRNVKPKQNSIK